MQSPKPRWLSKQQTYKIGEKVAEAADLTPGGSMLELVSRLGGTIQYRDLTEASVPDSIEVRAEGDFTIFLSSITSHKRDRFTIAHELGHYLLHYPLVKDEGDGGMVATRWVDPADSDLQRAEWEANWFAAGLSMPESAFRVAAETLNDADLAEQFQVSAHAVGIRKKELEI